jgi:hypothetical protein
MMLKRLQTFVLVTTITLLIWLIAESQSLDAATKQIQLRLITPEASGLIITSGGSDDRIISVDLQGSTASLDRLLNRLNNLGGSIDLVLDTPGEPLVDVMDALTMSPPFRASGVNVRSVEPPTISGIRIERVVEIPDVRLALPDLPAGVELMETALIQPPVVTVRAPESMASVLAENRIGEIILSETVLDGLQPGLNVLEQQRIRLPASGNQALVVIDPPTARVTLNVRDATVTWESERELPVNVLLPADLTGEYRVVLNQRDRFIRVRFTGPAQGIEALQADLPRAVPFIYLRSDELEAGEGQAVLRFQQLPVGVIATPIDGETGDEQAEVEFTVEKLPSS